MSICTVGATVKTWKLHHTIQTLARQDHPLKTLFSRIMVPSTNKRVNTPQLPSQSPDLNPIKNLQHCLKIPLNKQQPTNLEKSLPRRLGEKYV